MQAAPRDATPPGLSVEQREELDRLRARVYGPVEGAPPDASERARLDELEAAARRAAEPRRDDEATAIAEASAAPGQERGDAAPADEGADRPVDHADPETDESVSDPGSPDSRRGVITALRGTRGQRVVWAALGAVVGAAAVFGVTTLTAPRPDIALQIIERNPDPADLSPALRRFASNEDVEVTRFESLSSLVFLGQTREDGVRCILVLVDPSADYATGACAPPELSPSVDIPTYDSAPYSIIDPASDEPLPPNSLARVQWVGDELHITFAGSGDEPPFPYW